MEKDKCDFKSLVLTEEERDESNIFVCYERTQYHYFKRNHGVKNFIWMFADRIFGFCYSDGNEPIFSKYNGLNGLLESLQETYCIEADQLDQLMEEKFADGYQAHAMLKTYRPDGSFYHTSNYLEGYEDGVVYYTETNETMFQTCLSMEFDDLKSRFPQDKDGKITIHFIKAPESLFDDLKKDGMELFKEIMTEKYGYHLKDGKIYDKKDSLIKPTVEGLLLLADYFESSEDILKAENFTEKNQLRMYKHVANKVEPIIYSWKAIINNEDCSKHIDEKTAAFIDVSISVVERDLVNLTKWSSIVNGKMGQKYLTSYIKYLKKLASDFIDFQVVSMKGMTELLSV